jgi:large subunit ribosomal protein L24
MNTLSAPTRLKVRRGDTVVLLRGRDRGKQGKIMATLPREGRLIVEGLNMVKKHVKPRRSNEKGQRVSIAAPIQVGNVQVVCPQCNKATRVAIRRGANGERERACKHCSSVMS